MTFARQLEVGRIAEGLIACWLMARGNSVMPAYEIEKSHGKGPQLFSSDGGFVAPDMLVFSHNGMQWVEAKHKTVFTWHRNTSRWVTGIDIRHYGDYMHVAKKTKLPVWLMFFHRESNPSQADLKAGSPSECPTGLFGGELFSLVVKENHRAPRFDASRTGMLGHGSSGMVYWAADQLQLIATREEVMAVAGQIGIQAA